MEEKIFRLGHVFLQQNGFKVKKTVYCKLRWIDDWTGLGIKSGAERLINHAIYPLNFNPKDSAINAGS